MINVCQTVAIKRFKGDEGSMSELMEVDCPACSKPMRFRRKSDSRHVALNCPGCAHFFQVELQPATPAAQPVVATPIQAPVAAIDEFLANPEYSRPIITTRPQTSSNSDSGISPAAIKITAAILAGVLLFGFVGYVAYSVLSSLDLTAMVTNSGESPSTNESTNESTTDMNPEPRASSNDRSADNSFSASSVVNPSSTSSESPTANVKQSSSVLNSLAAGSSHRSQATSDGTIATLPAAPISDQRHEVNKPTVNSTDPNGSSSLTTTNERAAAENMADVIERAEQSVVRIEVTSADGDSLGSGFVVDQQGTIVTNCHVLAGALSAVAHFPNGRRCVVTGTKVIDQSRDIVIAQISDNSAPPIAIAGSLPRKGEQVTALGAPHGLAFTATRGIISAIRPGTEIGSEHQGTWVQVDAALSPGNSGGPLINSHGEVVGMSTLASQGTAQNLNFGISGQDIRTALTNARSAHTLTLAAGVGKVRMHEDGPSSGAEGQITQEAKISDAAFADYVTRGVDDFDYLLKSLRNESTRLSLELKEMKRGENYIPPAFRSEDAAVARVMAPGQRAPKWFFLNETTKQAVISRQLEKIKTFTKLKTEIRDSQDAGSLFELLWNHGPRLDVRRNNSLGYVSDLLVLHAFNEHDVLVLLDETPYLLWAPSTAGMSGGELWEGPVYVAGTATAQLRSGMTTSVTVLQLVSEKQLRAAVAKSIQPLDGYRTWTDHSGSFSIEAKLLGKDATTVSLQTREGKIVTVPREKLSAADVEFLDQ